MYILFSRLLNIKLSGFHDALHSKIILITIRGILTCILAFSTILPLISTNHCATHNNQIYTNLISLEIFSLCGAKTVNFHPFHFQSILDTRLPVILVRSLVTNLLTLIAI